MTKDKTSDRRFSQLAAALLLLGAIILIAGILPAIGGPGIPDTDNPFDGPQMDGVDMPFGDGSGTSPILGADQETSAGEVDNPFEGLSDEEERTVFYADVDGNIPYEASVGPYWRSDAYNAYEDGDWIRESGSADIPYSSSENRFTQEIYLEYPTNVLPAAYHADIESIESSEISSSDLEYSPEGGVHVDSVSSDGFSYEIDSVVPAASTDDLEDAPSDLSAEIEERYTNVPNSVPDRVEDFIDRKDLEGDSQYETARNVEEWIRTEKDYSLEASHDRDSDPVDQFLYEMDEGYCQYAASSMAVVLQAEDIPTRYVTGYATGDYVGNDRYEVTNMDAHAWVEVYFPDHGWIAFEPTPPGEIGGGDESDEDEDDRDEDDRDEDDRDEDDRNGTEMPFGDGTGTSPILGADQETSTGDPDNPFEGLSDDDEQTAFYAELDDPVPHEASVGPYWRFDAYNAYDDGDWIQESGSVDISDQHGEEVKQTIHLEYPTRVLPATYAGERQTIESDQISSDDLEYSSEDGIYVDSPTSDELSYVISSVVPTASTDDLEDAPSDLSAEIEERYTDVPGSVPDRVENFIDREDLEGNSQYETARNVEEWIRTEKDYSLEASHDRDSDPVDQFLYEMDEGYCQYAASSMAVVLQAEDIPTRYVTGYATGDPIGNDRYEVTNQHAHAWVEVYFPDNGWIAFEPTPPGEIGGGDEERDDDDEERDDDDEEEGDDSDPTSEYNAIFDPENPSVGDDTVITIEEDGEPVPNTDVQIVDGVNNDWYETNETGQIAYIVPPTDSIQIIISEDLETFNTFSTQTPTNSEQLSSAESHIDELPVDSQLSISALREPLLVGEQADFELALDDEPLDVSQVDEYDFTIIVEGEQQDPDLQSDGIATVDIPHNISDSAEITAEYGNLSSESTFDAGELEVDTSYEYHFALPGQEMKMNLYVDDTQLESIPIEHEGGLLTPDDNGTIVTTLPFSSSTSYTIDYGPNQITHEVNILRHSAALFGAALTGLLVGGVLYRRSGLSASSIYSTLRSGVFHVINQMISVTARLAGLLRLIGDHLTGGIQSILALPGELYQRWCEWKPDSISHAIWIRLSAVGVFLRSILSRSSTSPDSSSANPDSAPPDQSTLHIREIWGTFVKMVLPRHYHTKSPGEIARKAVQIGFPETPVRRLTSAFRQSEYGSGSTEQHVTEANNAFDSIQQSQEDDSNTTNNNK